MSRQESVNEGVRERQKSGEAEYQMASSIVGRPLESSPGAASIMDGPNSTSNTLSVSL